jgi:oligopeptide transport system substrate-binding protein
MFCKTCGSAFPDGAEFCGKCGAPVMAPAAPPTAAPATRVPPPVTPPPFASPPQGYGSPAIQPPQPPRRNKGLMWGIIAAVLVVVLGAGGTAAYVLTRGDDGKTVASSAGAGTTETAATVPATTPATASSDATLATTATSEITDAYRGGTLSVSAGEPSCIDPLNLVTLDDFLVADALFDGLTKYDYRTEELLPAAAASWEPNEDCTIWVFHLVKGATFHDGTPVTAADFKYAWERLCDPANASRSSYHLSAVLGYDGMLSGTASELAGVSIVDDYTLEVTLSYPFGDFEYAVGHPTLAPVPRASAQADPAAYAEKPIGNGPFMMSGTWAHGESIKVVRFEGYYGAKAHLDGVDFRFYADDDAAWKAFQADDLDFTAIPSGEIDAAKLKYGESADGITVSPREQVLTGPEASIHCLLLNNQDETLSNVALRRALSLAIDRQAICDDLYGGDRLPATNIVPEGIFGYEAGLWMFSRYDVNAAKAQLAEAGYPNGTGLPDLTVTFPTGYGYDDLLAMIQADWAAVGVNAVLDPCDWDECMDKLNRGDYMVGRLGWIGDDPTIDNYLYPLFSSGSSSNYSLYSDPAVDKELLEVRANPNRSDRTRYYGAVDKVIGDSCPVIPLTTYRHNHVGSDRVHDLVYSSMGLLGLDAAWISSE